MSLDFRGEEGPRRCDLMQRISVTSIQRCDDVFPDQAPAILTVFTAAGERLIEEVMVNRGGPDKPLNYEEVATKFHDNAKLALPSASVQSLRVATDKLPERTSVADIARLLAI